MNDKASTTSPDADPVDDYHARTDHEAVSRVWEALGVTEYTGKHIAEYVTELIAERDALRDAIEAKATWSAIQAGLGASEWRAFLWPEARALLTPKTE